MKKIKMSRGVTLTFEEGCKKYLENCRQRNLRDGTINHYRQSYLYFYKYFDPKMPIEDIDEQTYKDYVLHLKSTLNHAGGQTIYGNRSISALPDAARHNPRHCAPILQVR